MADRPTFLLAFDRGYCRMAQALIHSLERFHAEPDIRVYTMAEDLAYLRGWARRFSTVRVEVFHGAGFQHGDWHPLIWAKLQAFAATDVESCVVLDVDQIMYSEVSEFVEGAEASGRTIAASPDMTRLHGHMHATRREHPALRELPDAPCFNAGAMIIRPNLAVHRELQRLAREFHQYMVLPEQGILNLWAHWNEGHHDLTPDFMLPPMSPRILRAELDSCLIHFWTPRPPFFGASPARAGEPSWPEFTAAFERETGQPYPTERFRRDFERRLAGAVAASVSA